MTTNDAMRLVQQDQAAQDTTTPTTKRFADAQHPQGYPKDAEGWFITFGSNTPHGNQYARMKATDYAEARHEAFQRYGSRWGFMYPMSDLPSQIDAYGLTERDD